MDEKQQSTRKAGLQDADLALNPGSKIYFMGIGGTGMASVAGLMQAKGYTICGSDQQLYPPMSTMLENLGIQVHIPYSPENLRQEKPELVVVANCLSAGHPEITEMLDSGLPYTSFPHLLNQTVLAGPGNIVVAGTHGKTTTSSLVAWCLESLGVRPGFMIGGMPGNFAGSFSPGAGRFFVIEGDEYDSAFFDKGSKFLHYRPEYLVLNHIEFDHADIFKDERAVEQAFEKLVSQVSHPGKIIANLGDPGVSGLLRRMGLEQEVSGVWSQSVPASGIGSLCKTRLIQGRPLLSSEPGLQRWELSVWNEDLGTLEINSTIGGPHNFSNLCQTIGLLGELFRQAGLLDADLPKKISEALGQYKGVRRRLDYLGLCQGAEVYEDFAHHPTAVEQVIRAMRQARPQKRLLIAFDPANATCRRNVFMERYCQVFKLADQVLIGPVRTDHRIPEAERMDSAVLARMSGDHVRAFESIDGLREHLSTQLRPDDVLIFMSSGSFGTLPSALMESECSSGMISQKVGSAVVTHPPSGREVCPN